MGRPKDPNKMQGVSIRLPPDRYQELLEEAERLTMTQATAARVAVVEWLERRKRLRDVDEMLAQVALEVPDHDRVLLARLRELIADRLNAV